MIIDKGDMPTATTTAINQASNAALITGGALSFNEKLMLIGCITAVATFFVNTYFQWRRTRALEQQDKKES